MCLSELEINTKFEVGGIAKLTIQFCVKLEDKEEFGKKLHVDEFDRDQSQIIVIRTQVVYNKVVGNGVDKFTQRSRRSREVIISIES